MTHATVRSIADRKAGTAGLRPNALTPREIVTEKQSRLPVDMAALLTDRTRWMAACMIALVIAAVSLAGFINVTLNASANKELIYVRVQPNGTWDINFADASRSVEFLPATVDSLLTQFVTQRYQEIPHTVRQDYGRAQLFMAPAVAKAFMDPAQGNAVEKAASIMECLKCGEKHIEVRTINHFSGEKTEFGKMPGQLYRTNVFIREVQRNERGEVAGTPRLRIIPLQWRLMAKKEIEATLQRDGGVVWLRNNPIGLQILDYQLLDDPSEQSNTGTAK